MITLKTAAELAEMRRAGQIAAIALQKAGEAVRPGVTTAEIDKLVYDYIRSVGAIPSFLGYEGYPASACISINDVVIHGIPDGRVIREGDIVSIDIGSIYNGFHGDNAATFAAGEISEEAARLLRVTEESLYKGIDMARKGNRLGDVSSAVQRHCEDAGYDLVTDYTGHGIGREMHEAPQVPNVGTPGRGVRLVSGMTIAIEPMVNGRGREVKLERDGWTVRTRSGSLSAHFEHTVAITDAGPVILTRP